VAGAYVVFVVLILIYVAIMAARLQRTERELGELQRDLEAGHAAAAPETDRAADRQTHSVA
jgi:hypothetical protein